MANYIHRICEIKYCDQSETWANEQGRYFFLKQLIVNDLEELKIVFVNYLVNMQKLMVIVCGVKVIGNTLTL